MKALVKHRPQEAECNPSQTRWIALNISNSRWILSLFDEIVVAKTQMY